jgi:hypothetical protein
MRELVDICGSMVIAHQHPSLAGIRSGTGIRWSTGWHNDVRSWLYLQEIEHHPKLRRLAAKKQNYRDTADEAKTLYWKEGRFIVYDPKVAASIIIPTGAKKIFLNLLEGYNNHGEIVSAASGRNYAPAIFEKEIAAQGRKKEVLARAMHNLLHEKRIGTVVLNKGTKLEKQSLVVVAFPRGSPEERLRIGVDRTRIARASPWGPGWDRPGIALRIDPRPPCGDRRALDAPAEPLRTAGTSSLISLLIEQNVFMSYRDGAGQHGTRSNAAFDVKASRVGIGAALRTLYSTPLSWSRRSKAR